MGGVDGWVGWLGGLDGWVGWVSGLDGWVWVGGWVVWIKYLGVLREEGGDGLEDGGLVACVAGVVEGINEGGEAIAAAAAAVPGG